MTEERTENIISKILDSPGRLTDSDIDDIMHDDYLRRMYDTLSLLKSATAPTPHYNSDVEWQDLKSRLNGHMPAKKVSINRKWLGAAAIIIGVLLCGAVAIILFRNTDGDKNSELIVNVVNDTIPANTDKTFSSIKTNTAPEANTMSESYTYDNDSAIHIDKKAKPDCYTQSKPSVAIDEGTDTRLTSIEQALALTDGDRMMAQMFLDSYYDLGLYDNNNYITTVNYGEGMYEDAYQSYWLSEFKKYATGLTVDDLYVRRGSANMLYRLTCATTGVGDSDIDNALSILRSLLYESRCDSDTLTKVLIRSSLDNLK